MPALLPNPETQPFWDAAKQGRLLLRRCMACGEVHFYPRTICPFCFSDDTEWLVIDPDESQLGRGYFAVDAMRTFGSDCLNLQSNDIQCCASGQPATRGKDAHHRQNR